MAMLLIRPFVHSSASNRRGVHARLTRFAGPVARRPRPGVQQQQQEQEAAARKAGVGVNACLLCEVYFAVLL